MTDSQSSCHPALEIPGYTAGAEALAGCARTSQLAAIRPADEGGTRP